MPVDLLLRNAHVVDGTGAAPTRLNVGITDGMISALTASEDVAAARTLDLDGLVLTPGFIDIHTHSDVSLLLDPSGASKLLQGVTTEVVGNCGFSAFPSTAAGRPALLDHLARLGDAEPDLRWTDFAGYARALEQARPAINVAALVGHGALRIAAMSDSFVPSDADDAKRMSVLLDDALSQGAFGLSTGLTHTPSALGTSTEIEALTVVCTKHDALYSTHSRARAGNEFGAITEALHASRATGVRLQYSHLALNEPANWGRAGDALAYFDDAHTAGLDVAFDVYPYTASSSTLVQYLPEWVQAGGGPAIAANYADPRWRSRALADIATGWFGGIPWLWDRFTITAAGARTADVGSTLAELATRTGRPPAEVLLELCAEVGSAAQVVLHYRTEADVTEFVRHPLSCIGSDGSAVPLTDSADRPHPRGFGTFPRVLGRYVRERGELALAEAVSKMTSGPAARLGLSDRGLIRAGYVADLVVFDPSVVLDQATFEHPRQPPSGIRYVIVGGLLAAERGQVSSVRNGEVLRHG